MSVRQQDVCWLEVHAWHDRCYIAGIPLLAHSLTVKSSLAAVAGSVALFYSLPDFVVLNQRVKARIKNCKFFGLNEAKELFLRSSNACLREFPGRALTTLLAV